MSTALVDPDGPELCVVPSNPVPEGARVGYFRTTDRVRLRYALFPRTQGASKGTVCLLHGRTEFIEKYFETIADFQKRGFAVATFDWRGQGGSDRLIAQTGLGYVDRFEDYWTDINSFHAEIMLPDCPPPFNLVAHSMGGLAALHAAARDRLMFERVFLSAPLIGLEGLPLGTGAMAGLFEAASFLGLGALPLARREDRPPSRERFGGNPLTSDVNRYMRSVDIFAQRPDLMIGSPTLRWLAASLGAMAAIERDEFPGTVRVPVLMLAAARDSVVSTAAIEQLGLRMRTGRHQMIPTARHELFMENDTIRGQVFAAFDAFVTERTTI